MIRSELFHPISVHFPVVLICLLFVGKVMVHIIKKEEQKELLRQLNLVFLIASLVTSFISIYLGDMAFEIVRPNLCKIGNVDTHEEFSKLLALTLFLLLLMETLFLVFKEKINQWLKLKDILSFVFLFCAIFYLFKTAHTGANLVYEQGAAVQNYPKNCQ